MVAVAIEILETEGFNALTLRRLAAKAGISRTTPYLYFKDKADLLVAVCVNTFRFLTEQCRTIIEDNPTPVQQVTAFGENYLKFALKNPVLYQLTFAPETTREEVAPEVMEVVEEYNTLLAVPMQQAYDAGHFLYPPDRLNAVLWAALHGMLSLHWSGHLAEEDQFDQILADMRNILAFGFINRDKVREDYPDLMSGN
nr:TetR/AcrR family transcriptional regulator [Sneathiella chinensis]